jgi:hypothetical protein
MHTVVRAMLIATVLLLPNACASTGNRPAGEPPSRGDLLTLGEMQNRQWSNVYDMVSSLRPRWLQVRGPDTLLGEPGEVQVVVDGVKHGGVGTLRTYPVTGIVLLQFYDGITASSRWGLGFGHGAIHISTRAP